jgi:hypothetical protein
MQKKQHPNPTPKPATKPKLTDAERHKRFVDMAHEVEADESQKAFDEAFATVVPPSEVKVKARK